MSTGSSSALNASQEILGGSQLGSEDVMPEPDLNAADKPNLSKVEPARLEITHARVIELLDSRNRSIPRERVARLMLYAYEATGMNAPYEELPEPIISLEVGMKDWIHSWVGKNLDGMRKIIKDQREVRYLHEESAGFAERYEWVENADRISKMQPFNPEALIVSAAVRVILVDPETAVKQT